LSDDLEVTRVLAGYIVIRGDRKLAGPFGTWRSALEWLDSQKPKRDRTAADLDAQNT
jgi:hypothetical protein